MTKFPFTDDRCRKLYELARPVGDYHAFAWRESPNTLQNHWGKATKGKSESEKDELLRLCLAAGVLQSKYRIDDERRGNRLNRPKGIAPWFAAGDYYKELIGPKDEKERTIRNTCTFNGCDEDVHGPRFDLCSDHLARTYR